MRLDDERESDQVDDRRGDGGGGFGLGGGGLGIGGVALALVASWFLGVDPRTLLGLASHVGGGTAEVRQAAPRAIPKEDPEAHFVAKVLASTEDVWTQVFAERGQSYRKPRLVLFSGRTGTACGTGQTAQGPFYCPGDERVYIDLDFYRELQTRFHAPGEFAQAYVIAHEVGHHVQKLRGISAKVEQAERAAGSRAGANALSVRLELQADCFAGVWGHFADKSQHLIEAGEVEEGAARGRRDRRRYPPEAGARLRSARYLHPRDFGPAGVLVPQGDGQRRPAPVQSLQGSRSRAQCRWPSGS